MRGARPRATSPTSPTSSVRKRWRACLRGVSTWLTSSRRRGAFCSFRCHRPSRELGLDRARSRARASAAVWCRSPFRLAAPPDVVALSRLQFDATNWADVELVAARIHATEAVLALAVPIPGKVQVWLKRIGAAEMPTKTSFDVPLVQNNLTQTYPSAADTAVHGIEDMWRQKGPIDLSSKDSLDRRRPCHIARAMEHDPDSDGHDRQCARRQRRGDGHRHDACLDDLSRHGRSACTTRLCRSASR